MADRTKLDEYIQELEAAAYARGRSDAQAEIYAQLKHLHESWTANASLLQEQLAATVAKISTTSFEPPSYTGPNVVMAETREPREGSEQAKVLGVIREHPGLRGIEVVKALNGKVEERTVRTALFRLKHRNAIVQKEGGWHPVPLALFRNSESQTP